MKQVLSLLLYWSCVQISSSLPLEESGFTAWPLRQRDLMPITALDFSGLKGNQLGISESANFGIPDPTCRQKLPGKGCWEMNQFTVDKMINAREKKANECKVPCLFYTSKLSGAAERLANFVLWDALLLGADEQRKYQTIWDLHDRKYYPKANALDETPEVKCAYLDMHEEDLKNQFSGCQRRYFMSMSKAMAAECSGEVFLLTTSDLVREKDVPENGIWWEVEFPTLIDERRPQDKKVTKITYLQVEQLSDEKFEELQNLPDDQKSPPQIVHTGEYWPTGHGKTQLEKSKKPGSKQTDPQHKRSPTNSDSDIQEHGAKEHGNSTIGFVKRADQPSGQICAPDDECYPYAYPLKDMYEWYKDAVW